MMVVGMDPMVLFSLVHAAHAPRNNRVGARNNQPMGIPFPQLTQQRASQDETVAKSKSNVAHDKAFADPSFRVHFHDKLRKLDDEYKAVASLEQSGMTLKIEYERTNFGTVRNSMRQIRGEFT
jgi:hypothetical protein